MLGTSISGRGGTSLAGGEGSSPAGGGSPGHGKIKEREARSRCQNPSSRVRKSIGWRSHLQRKKSAIRQSENTRSWPTSGPRPLCRDQGDELRVTSIGGRDIRTSMIQEGEAGHKTRWRP